MCVGGVSACDCAQMCVCAHRFPTALFALIFTDSSLCDRSLPDVSLAFASLPARTARLSWQDAPGVEISPCFCPEVSASVCPSCAPPPSWPVCGQYWNAPEPAGLLEVVGGASRSQRPPWERSSRGVVSGTGPGSGGGAGPKPPLARAAAEVSTGPRGRKGSEGSAGQHLPSLAPVSRPFAAVLVPSRAHAQSQGTRPASWRSSAVTERFPEQPGQPCGSSRGQLRLAVHHPLPGGLGGSPPQRRAHSLAGPTGVVRKAPAGPLCSCAAPGHTGPSCRALNRTPPPHHHQCPHHSTHRDKCQRSMPACPPLGVHSCRAGTPYV